MSPMVDSQNVFMPSFSPQLVETRLMKTAAGVKFER